MGTRSVFGSELALGKGTFRGYVWYRFFGHDLMGLRIRALHFQKMINEVPAPRSVLDAGSGEGCYTFYLARRFPQAEQVLGVDRDGDLIANCNLILSKVGLSRLKFIQADLATYDARTKFDLICCIDALEHIVEDDVVLRNLRCALQVNGVLLLHVPQRHQLNKHFFQWLGNTGLKRQAGHVRDEYTEADITNKLEGADFKVVERRYTFGRFGSLARELAFAIEGLGTLRPAIKALAFPFLMGLASMDTLTSNKRAHQGFLFKATTRGNRVDHAD